MLNLRLAMNGEIENADTGPLPPSASIAGLTNNPTYGQTAQIGVELTGVVANGTASAHAWTLDGVAISGATSVTYTPVAGDDEGVLRYAPTVDAATVTSAPYTVRYTPPVAGSLAPVNETQGSGTPTVNVAAGFTGSDLTYTEAVAWASIAGSTLTINDEVRTDTVTITATNSGGSADVDLSVTITAPAPVVGITGLTSNPTHGDTAQIGVQLTGTVTNGTASAHSWTLDGTPISGATASTYTPVAGDDLGALRYAPTVNAQTVTSDPETVRYAPPVGGSLTAVNTTQGSGAPTVDVSAGFTGSDLTYSEAVSWASISGSTLTIDDVVRTDTVTITASNSGGSDTVDLSVTITAPASGQLTLPTSTVLAYSAARAFDGYTGNIIRVRRSSDNTELDIGTDANGDLDEAALLAHTGTGGSDQGFVVTLYEQSGHASAVDLTQATLGGQPLIVDGGAVIKRSGKPSMQILSGDSMSISGWTTRPSIIAVHYVAEFLTGTGDNNVFFSGSGAHYFPAMGTSSSTALTGLVGTPSFYKDGDFMGAQDGVTTRQDLWDAYVDNGLALCGASELDGSNSAWASIQTRYNASISGPDYFSEVILTDDPKSQDVVDMEANQASYYSIAGYAPEALSKTYVSGAFDDTGTTGQVFTVEENSKYILGASGSTTSGGPIADPTITNGTNARVLGENLFGTFDAVSFTYFETGAGVTSVTVDANWLYRVGYALYKVTGFNPDDPASYSLTFESGNHQGSEHTIDAGEGDAVIYMGIVEDLNALYSTPGPDWSASSADFAGSGEGFQSVAFSETFAADDASFAAGSNATVAGTRDAAGILYIKQR